MTSRSNKRASVIKGCISTTAVVLIAAHLMLPSLRIDAITVSLLVIGVVPWVIAFVQSARFPGGWEITFRDVKAAGEKITAGETTPAPDRPHGGTISLATTDPNLALVGLRIEIEKRVRVIAQAHSIPSNKPLHQLIEDLRQMGIIPTQIMTGIAELIAAGNSAAHGALVEDSVAGWALAHGPEIIAALAEVA